MKKKTSLLLMLVFIMLCMTGCSSVPKEKQIKQDIMDASSSLALAENEKVVDIEIKDRKTDKKTKSDQVICIVKTELDNVSYEKGYTLSYHKFDNGWKMQSIIIGESADWVIKPLKGVNEEQIKNSLAYKTINVDGELWTIEDGEISNIVIKKQDTDLDKGKDKVTIKIKLNGEMEEVEGTIKAEYDFDKKWELKDMEDENDFSSKEKADKALNVSDGLTGVDGVSEIEEKVVLSNERGVTVTFWSLAHELGGRSGVSMLQADITIADDSEFVPGFPDGTNTDFSTLGNFIVAKVHIIGELDMKRDSDFTPVDSGATFYAVVPESYLGTREFVGQAGNVDEFSFDYPTPYAFIAESSDGTFTVGEERDVVKILKSFKVAE